MLCWGVSRDMVGNLYPMKNVMPPPSDESHQSRVLFFCRARCRQSRAVGGAAVLSEITRLKTQELKVDVAPLCRKLYTPVYQEIYITCVVNSQQQAGWQRPGTAAFNLARAVSRGEWQNAPGGAGSQCAILPSRGCGTYLPCCWLTPAFQRFWRWNSLPQRAAIFPARVC